MLQQTINKSGQAIRRILDEAGVFTKVRAIADRLMRERGGDGMQPPLLLRHTCPVVLLLTDWLDGL